MDRRTAPPLKLYTGDSLGPDPFDPHVLAMRELLRPPQPRRGHREIEPFTRSWYEEIELKRYSRGGEWLPRSLEFSRHRHESLLMLGPGLGTDAIQYQRHETAVTIGVTENDPADAVSKNFASRGRSGTVIHVELDRLPFHSDSFDLAYLNALHPLTVELPVVIREIHRILKPGGKVFGLFPARFDIRYWCRRLMPVTRWIQCVPAGSGTAAGTNARELRKVFAQFEKQSIAKRHLKRTELPKLWQLLPVEFLQRLFGHILVFKGLKPIHTSLRQVARAA